KWPLRWTRTTASHSSSPRLISMRSRRKPALLTSVSSRPNAPIAVSTSAAAPASVAMSSVLATARPPSASISRTTSCAGPSEASPVPSRATPRSLTTTWAPCRANSRACARPSPRPAPVTATTRSWQIITAPSVPAAAGAGGRSGSLLVDGGGVEERGALSPAVQLHRRPADVGREAGREEHARGADVVGVGEPAERDGLRHRPHALLVAVVQVGLLGADHAERQGVDADLRRPRDGHRPPEVAQAGPRGAVGGRSGRRPLAAHAADVHDRAAAVLQHPGAQRPRHDQRR